MKIYSDDGKEFQSVEACEEYENSLKKSKEEAQQKLKSFVKEYIGSHLYAEVVITRNNEMHYVIALHDNYEQAMLLPTVLIEQKFGKRVTSSHNVLTENYKQRTLTKKELGRLCGVVYDFLEYNNFDVSESGIEFIANKGYDCAMSIYFAADELVKGVTKIKREMAQGSEKSEVKNTNTKSCCLNESNVRFVACSPDEFFSFLENVLNIR